MNILYKKQWKKFSCKTGKCVLNGEEDSSVCPYSLMASLELCQRQLDQVHLACKNHIWTRMTRLTEMIRVSSVVIDILHPPFVVWQSDIRQTVGSQYLMSSNSKLHENATFIGSGWEGEGKQTKNGKRKTSVLSGSPNGSDNKYMFSLQINYFRFFLQNY